MKLHKFQKFMPCDWYEKALNDTKENTRRLGRKNFKAEVEQLRGLLKGEKPIHQIVRKE